METKKVMSVTAWVARDESYGGHLHLFPEKPSRCERRFIEDGNETSVTRIWQSATAATYTLNDSDSPELAGMVWSDEPKCVRMELYFSN